MRDFISIMAPEEKRIPLRILVDFCNGLGGVDETSSIVRTLWIGIALESAGALMLSSSSAFLFLTRKPVS